MEHRRVEWPKEVELFCGVKVPVGIGRNEVGWYANNLAIGVFVDGENLTGVLSGFKQAAEFQANWIVERFGRDALELWLRGVRPYL